ncbi:hypothetical protein F441_17594 [Phytophthora nicotianae CJ01A1]|uniref:Uncharacterized protein n=5 Tax=Phytophthora nicotianae TaxID=4792 RepID=V9EAG6_PHYNI|nr:hypothetical protein F443_17713 [Phytophthora nicotianae P1569]ETL29777.1 hypothetical protein L916_17141 [Phytophthora nicotianae]ETO64833.1 hypothetical protein F444_17753 [Phytophthora nicotianae P1976]ETP05928.1 hypothetical protein F441_17594 [Phytophthora nicotianae CJ01A1]ETP34029.1 hypothetical protein F442_17571 [Phytophthora nicotianae P10297]
MENSRYNSFKREGIQEILQNGFGDFRRPSLHSGSLFGGRLLPIDASVVRRSPSKSSCNATMRFILAGGGSYLHIRVITGVSTATFYRVVYRVMFAINDAEILAPRFPKTQAEMKEAATGF